MVKLLVIYKIRYYQSNSNEKYILGIFDNFGDACRKIIKNISNNQEINEYEEENIVNSLIHKSKFRMLYDNDLWVFKIKKLNQHKIHNLTHKIDSIKL